MDHPLTKPRTVTLPEKDWLFIAGILSDAGGNALAYGKASVSEDAQRLAVAVLGRERPDADTKPIR